MAKAKRKPKKPYPDFPLFAHQNGQWCKKIRGKQLYFGRWDDPNAALQEYLRTRDDLQAGRQPRSTTGATLAEMVNAYLTAAKNRTEAGGISPVTFSDYKWTGKAIIGHFGRTVAPEGIRPTEFARFRNALTANYSPSRVGKMVTQTRMIFRWAFESEVIEAQPNFGPDFKSTSKRESRIAKAKRVDNLFAAEQIHELLDRADDSYRAMILLGINCGVGNTDISQLTRSMLDYDSGWLDYPRPKTGVERRMPLWPETVTALKRVLNARPTPSTKKLSDRVFLTRTGCEVVDVKSDGQRVDKLTIRFRRLLQLTDLYSKGLGFYTLRHTFQTVGDDARDPLATSHIMGHIDSSISGQYRERISDERLLAVSNHVHRWLYGVKSSG